jgi:hypothetical protein
MSRNWREWHTAYDDPDSRLTRRLAVVQDLVRGALDRCRPGPIRLISMCAGEGRDLLGVLADHPRAGDVSALLVELDAQLAATAAARAPAGVTVVRGDASNTSAYEGIVPADVVLVCGVFGNVVDDDIHATVAALPMLCSAGATVIWTRHRRAPDRTVDIRRWFAEAGFEEVAFVGSEHFLFGVGAHRLAAAPRPYVPGIRLFRFVGYDTLT